jgi:serine protease Do
MRVADVILSIDDVPLISKEDFYSILATYTPDDRIELDVLRGLDERRFSLQLSVLPDGYVIAYTRRVFGFELRETARGLLINLVEDGSPADEVGLKKNDLIARVAGYELETLDQFHELMVQLLGREPVEFVVVRDNRGYLVELP